MKICLKKSINEKRKEKLQVSHVLIYLFFLTTWLEITNYVIVIVTVKFISKYWL